MHYQQKNGAEIFLAHNNQHIFLLHRKNVHEFKTKILVIPPIVTFIGIKLTDRKKKPIFWSIYN